MTGQISCDVTELFCSIAYKRILEQRNQLGEPLFNTLTDFNLQHNLIESTHHINCWDFVRRTRTLLKVLFNERKSIKKEQEDSSCPYDKYF